MKSVLAKCPTCGAMLTDEHLYGIYLRCSACTNEYRFQDGVLSTFTTYYYAGEMTWAEFLNQAFSLVLGKVSGDLFSNMRITLKDEAYLPYVDVVTAEKQTYLMPIAQQGNGFLWLNDDMPVITDTKHLKLSSQSGQREDITAAGRMKVVEYSTQKLEALRNVHRYVSNDVLYIHVKVFRFEYEGRLYRLVCYGNKVESLNEPLATLVTDVPQSKGELKLPTWLCRVIMVFTAAVVIGAWMKYCYTFQQIYGLKWMFVFKSGYECVFRFLGTSILAIIGGMTIELMLRRIYQGMHSMREQLITTAHASRLLQIANSKP